MIENSSKPLAKRGARKAGSAPLPIDPVITPAATAIAAVQVAVAQAAEAKIAAAAPVLTPADTIEAAPSPAVSSDPAPAETLAPFQGGTPDMATVIPNMTDTAGVTTEKLQSMFGDMGARFKASFEKQSKLGEEMVELTKGNVEAVVASARVAAKGGEVIGQDAADFGKKSFESAVAAMKGFASIKSPTELFQLQSEFAKASFDSAVAEASRFSETMMKLAGDVAQPLSTRYAVAAEKIKAATL